MTRKWTLLGLFALGAGALVLAGCDEDQVLPPQEVSITVTPSTVPPLNVGQTVQLVAQVSGTNNTAVNWTTSNAQVATVSATGLVTAVGAGTATITATALADTTKKAAVLITVNPPPAVSITLLPASATLFIGDSLPLVATVTGTTNTAVTFRTSNAAVATVSATGLVRAVGAGTAIITAIAQADTTKRAQSTITVNAPPEPTVSIKSITRFQTNIPVDPSNAFGQIDVTVNFEAPAGSRVTRVAVLVDGTEACGQSVSTEPPPEAQAQAEFVCSINTAAYTVASGATTATVRFPNGSHTITARLTRSGGFTPKDASTTLTFNNADQFLAQVSTSNTGATARDAAGLLWTGNSDVTVRAIPIVYATGSGRAIARVTIALDLNGSCGVDPVRTDTTATDGFSVTFLKSATCANNGVASALTPSAGLTSDLGITISSVRADGTSGPASTDPAGAFVNDSDTDPANDIVFRLDNQAPVAGTFVLTSQTNGVTFPAYADTACCAGNWVGPAYSFAAGKAGQTDGAGVGGVTVTFHAGDASLSDAALVALPPVTTGNDLAATTVASAYRARARVRDALGNESFVNLTTTAANPLAVSGTIASFGVDKQAPTASFAGGVANQAVFTTDATFNYVLGATDDVAGFTTTPWLVTVDRNRLGATASSRCLVGSFSATAGVCRIVGFGPASGATVTVGAGTGDGYYTLTAFVRDQAGNASTTITRVVLKDDNAPTASNITFPATFTGAAATLFAVTAVDSTDVISGDLRLDYAALGEGYPFAAPVTVGAQFDAVLTTSAGINVTIPFIRGVEAVTGTNAPSGTVHPATGATFRILDGTLNDAAPNLLVTSQAFSAGAVPAGTSANALNVATFVIQSTEPDVCNGDATAGECLATNTADPTSTTLRAVAAGPSGTFANPFTTVYFYRIDAGGVIRLIGSTSAASVTDVGSGPTGRTWTWSITFNATGLPAQATHNVFAIGVDSAGDGLRAANLNVPILAGN